jgi:hypothetical protein
LTDGSHASYFGEARTLGTRHVHITAHHHQPFVVSISVGGGVELYQMHDDKLCVTPARSRPDSRVRIRPNRLDPGGRGTCALGTSSCEGDTITVVMMRSGVSERVLGKDGSLFWPGRPAALSLPLLVSRRWRTSGHACLVGKLGTRLAGLRRYVPRGRHGMSRRSRTLNHHHHHHHHG